MQDIESRQLYELSREDARTVLDAFLLEENRAISAWAPRTNVLLDYSADSVCRLFEYALHRIRDDLGSTKIGEDEYDRFRSVWILRAAHYFGESLIRSFPHLRWDLGEVGTAYQNHPVIAGFPGDVEVAAISVTKNVLFSVLSQVSGEDRICRTIEHWFSAARTM